MRSTMIMMTILLLLALGGCMDRVLDNPVDPTEHGVYLPTPVINPAPGFYNTAKQISMTCSVPGVQIRYTTGGGEPSSSSNLYTEPFTISSNMTIKAKAFKSGWGPSPTAYGNYYITIPACSAPTFSVAGGTYYAPFMLSLNCTTQGAEIHYTTTGGEPTLSSPKFVNPISVTSPMTVRARAFRTSYLPSVFSSATYSLTVRQPVFSHTEGIYTDTFLLQVSCDTPGAVIHYTTTGPEPTTSSPVYTNPISVTSTMTVKAKAFLSPYLASLTKSAAYSLASSTPSFDPPGGTYATAQDVRITTTTSGDEIRYTLDNSIPTETSPLYTGPLHIALDITVRARGFRTGWIPGYVGTATYNITGP